MDAFRRANMLRCLYDSWFRVATGTTPALRTAASWERACHECDMRIVFSIAKRATSRGAKCRRKPANLAATGESVVPGLAGCSGEALLAGRVVETGLDR